MNAAAELRRIGIFADLPAEHLEWLASAGRILDLQPGDAVFHEGDPANLMFAVLEGELRGARERPPADGRVYVHKVGKVAGMLPFSRMKEFPVTTSAVLPARVLIVPTSAFEQMLERMPVLESRLIAIMADRVRETAHEDHKRETLMALGKLSAGLAHELNNPAAAARRASSQLRERLGGLPELSVAFAERLGVRPWAALDRLLRRAVPQTGAAHFGTMERADREDELLDWLAAHDVEDAERLAATFVERGISVEDLDVVGGAMPQAALSASLAWAEAVIVSEVLAREIELASTRISDLVAAVKSYSRMDQAPAKTDTDIHESLETTLTVLAHKLRHKGVHLARHFDPELPRVSAFAGELNQVWTNLIDNAVDAAPAGGHIEVRTAREPASILVEIADDGPGIPPDDLPRIFEPFFSTKPVGEGTGLGLDIAQRIVVRRHSGDIRVDSRPGETRFQVRLPLAETVA